MQLNSYVQGKVIEDRVKVRSFTIATDIISICYSKEAESFLC